MAESVPLPSLAATSALYMTQNTYHVCAGGNWERVLIADPRRYWVQFTAAVVQTSAFMPLPGPLTGVPVPLLAGGQTSVYKWTDCPSIVSGEWYLAGTMGQGVYITECLYVGG